MSPVLKLTPKRKGRGLTPPEYDRSLSDSFFYNINYFDPLMIMIYIKAFCFKKIIEMFSRFLSNCS